MSFLNRLKNLLFFHSRPEVNEFVLKDKDQIVNYDVRREKNNHPQYITNNYDYNLKIIEETFSYPDNNDFVIRKLKILENTKAFLIFYDGMVSTEAINLAIIKPLLELPRISPVNNKKEIMERLIAHSQATKVKDFSTIIDDVNFGSCGVFIDGLDFALSLDVRNWGHRGIEKPEMEQSLYGPQEAFSEMLRNNSALVRKILKTEKLICEGVKIGKISKTRGVLMYISDLANNDLVNEVKKRIDGISVDYVIAIEEVSLFLEEKSFMVTNQIMATERPDRVARFLSEGRVALILNGSPKALIFPTNAFELIHSASDGYLRVPYANMTRGLRLLSMFISLLLPALYLAITLYHQEMVPTFLLYSISAARENVPFPSIVELLIMNFSFELVREAGIRMPGTIGSTLGIVGGLILGQAAVSAKIVSPLMIIVIAITGIASFAISDYSLEWSYRILRLIFIILAALGGFYAVAIGIFLYSVFLGSYTSFGVPFLSPMISGNRGSMSKSVFVNPIWKNEKRPDFLKTKDDRQEPKISRKWKINKRK